VQPDGRIVVAGFAYVDGATFTDFALARFNSDGTLDSGFGTGGKVTTDFGATSDYPGGIALQVDGKIVVAGEHNDPGGGFDYALARYNSDGSLDTTFGSNGRVTTALGATNDSPVTLTVQPDGRIVIASGYDATATNSDFLVARYTATGALDTTFNPGGSLGGGVVTTDLGASFESARAVAVQPDGKIVAAGVSGSPAAMALVRYNADGSPDTTFGASGDGTLIYPLGSSSAAAYGVALQPNGKIVVAGASSNGADNDFTLVRFTADGSADGARIDPVGSANDSAFALAVEPDGRLIAAGAGNDGTATGVSVAR